MENNAKNAAFFYKERKRMQRTLGSFIKNGKKCKNIGFFEKNGCQTLGIGFMSHVIEEKNRIPQLL